MNIALPEAFFLLWLFCLQTTTASDRRLTKKMGGADSREDVAWPKCTESDSSHGLVLVQSIYTVSGLWPTVE